MSDHDEVRARMRAESVLDRGIPLCLDPVLQNLRPELGPTASEYYALPHAALTHGVSCGEHCPLHSAQLRQGRRSA
jgi:hypothetical protein